MLALEDSRRMEGPNLLSERTGAVIEVSVSGFPIEKVVETWSSLTRKLLDGVDWNTKEIVTRIFQQGADLGITAPPDCLHSALAIVETAWRATTASLNEGRQPDLSDQAIEGESETLEGVPLSPLDQIAELKALIAGERNPAVMRLKETAEEHEVGQYVDQTTLSVGSGTGAQSWPINQIPSPNDFNWSDVRDVPIVLVTGTNGKSTTVRLAEAILGAAGIRAGAHTTEGVYIVCEDSEEHEDNDKKAVLALLRNTDNDVVLSEVSRRCIIRRGLPVSKIDIAVVTNLAADHLGTAGINTLEDLASVHFVVSHALKEDGVLILNADDPQIVRYAESVEAKICWFSLHPDNPLVVRQIERGERGCYIQDNSIICASRQGREALIPISDIPITLAGTARHDVSNSLAAVCMTKILGVPTSAIVNGLMHFRGDAADNPGRGNYFDLDGVNVLLDYAHNAHGLSAIVNTIIRMPAKRRLVLFDQESDHPEEEIRRLARMAWSMQPDKFIISTAFEEGSGVVPAVIHDELKCLGTADDRIEHVNTSLEGVQRAVTWAEEGDFLLLLAHSEPGKVLDFLKSRQKESPLS